MTHRIPPRIHGRDHWQQPTVYIHVSDPSARFVRPDDEPHVLVGLGVIALALFAIVGAVLLISLLHEAPATSASVQPASSVAEGAAGQTTTKGN